MSIEESSKREIFSKLKYRANYRNELKNELSIRSIRIGSNISLFLLLLGSSRNDFCLFKLFAAWNRHEILFKPFKGISRVVIIDHSLNFSWVSMEVAESSAHVISLDVVLVYIIAYCCSKNSKELSNIS